MQPDKQDQNQYSAQPEQQYPPSSQQPYQVPDYLGLAPVVIAKKSKSKLLIILLGIVLVVAISVSAWFAWGWFQKAPERRFYQAIDNMMQVSYLQRHYIVKTADNSYSADINERLDCTKLIDCERSMNYTYNTFNKLNLKGEEIILHNNDYFEKTTQSTPATLKSTKIGQWYKISNEPGSGIYNLTFQQSFLPTGKFANDQRTKIIDYIIDNNTYDVMSNKADTYKDEAVTMYEVKTDTKKQDSLGAKVAELTRNVLTKAPKNLDGLTDVNIWVSNKTNMVVKVSSTFKDTSGQVIQASYDIDYPGSVKIIEPQGAISQ